LETDDLKAILESRNLQAILIPKVESKEHIKYVSHMIDTIGSKDRQHDVKILASIESAVGLLNVKDIILADKRVEGLVFAAEDYSASLGLIRTPSRLEMLYARQQIVTTASAFGLQSIDLVCVDFKSPEILQEECREGRTFGFSGKQAIHPNQVAAIHDLFSPSQADLNYAERILKGYEEHGQKGFGAFNLDGKMIDMVRKKVSVSPQNEANISSFFTYISPSLSGLKG
jgi:citrate lyase subunit beta-like protein